MNLKYLINLYGVPQLVHRIILTNSGYNRYDAPKLEKLIDEILTAEIMPDPFVVELNEGKLRLKGIEDSDDTFKLMSRKNLASLNFDFPVKMATVITLIEEYCFFRFDT